MTKCIAKHLTIIRPAAIDVSWSVGYLRCVIVQFKPSIYLPRYHSMTEARQLLIPNNYAILNWSLKSVYLPNVGLWLLVLLFFLRPHGIVILSLINGSKPWLLWQIYAFIKVIRHVRRGSPSLLILLARAPVEGKMVHLVFSPPALTIFWDKMEKTATTKPPKHSSECWRGHQI